MPRRARRAAALAARRWALAALPRLGHRVTRIGPALHVVSGPRHERDVARIGKDAWLLQPRKRTLDVADAGPGRFLLTDPAAEDGARLGTRAHRKREKAITRLLAVEHVVGLLALYGVTCVLDVGANRGQFGRSLRRAGYRGRIVSFEPVPTVYRHLEKAAAGDPHWTTHQFALGREDTTVPISHRPVHSGLSSLLPPTDFGARSKGLQEEIRVDVRMRRLGDVLDELLSGPPGAERLYLKMDTQGFDLEVFAGLGHRSEDVVALQSELAFVPMYEGMPRACEALAAYEQAGFEVSAIYPVRREYRTARAIECDCVMVRAAARAGAPD